MESTIVGDWLLDLTEESSLMHVWAEKKAFDILVVNVL